MNWLFGKITDITDEQYKNIFEALSNSRKAHIIRFKKEEDRRRSLMATYLVCELLKELGLVGVSLENAENGRPYLKGSDLFISISHSLEGVACAVSETPIGIDVEKIRPVKKGLIEYVCTKQEQEYVFSDFSSAEDISDTSVMQKFYTVWTAKEAYFKKNASGITDICSVDTFSFEKQTYCIDGFIITIV